MEETTPIGFSSMINVAPHNIFQGTRTSSFTAIPKTSASPRMDSILSLYSTVKTALQCGECESPQLDVDLQTSMINTSRMLVGLIHVIVDHGLPTKLNAKL